jgi:uncharacterized BrkB/YihY/UPF0761 family membrane protein
VAIALSERAHIDVAAGGLLTAVLFDAGRWVVGLYLAH